MSSFEKNRPSTTIIDHEIAETINNDERTAVNTPEFDTDLEKQKNKSEAQETPAATTTTTIDPTIVVIEIPDGGVVAWGTVFGAWCILFATFGMTQAFGVYQDYYVRFFLTKYTPSDIGWIGSIQLFFQFAMGIVAGKLFDAGYFYIMMPCASLLYVFSYFMLSLAKPNQFYQVFLSHGIGAGIALGFLFLPAIGVVAHHFKHRRGFAVGIVVSGSSCGGLVFPVMLNHIIPTHGFAWATRAVAFLATVMMAIAVLCMRTRLPPRKKMPVNADAPPLPTIKQLATDVRYMFAIAGAFLGILGIFVPVFYMQLYAINHGVNQQLAFYTITILNGAGVFGRIVPSLIGDKFGPFNALIFTTFACGLLSLCMLAAKNTVGIVAICVFYGLFSGAYFSLMSSLFTGLANHVSETGIRLGVGFTVVSFACLAGTPIAGALLTPHLHWARPLVFSGATIFAGLFFLIASRWMTARQKGTWRV